MEYFVGSIVTLVMVSLIGLIFRGSKSQEISSITYSQSYIHQLVYPYLFTNEEILDTIPTQSSKHSDAKYIRILIVDGLAYWIKNNVFYVAKTDGDEVIKETAIQVDTMAMDKVQLDKMMFIVGKLTEGKANDSWNAG
jgi:hypothetical protein